MFAQTIIDYLLESQELSGFGVCMESCSTWQRLTFDPNQILAFDPFPPAGSFHSTKGLSAQIGPAASPGDLQHLLHLLPPKD